MFHSSGINTGYSESSVGLHQQLQQSPVYLSSARTVPQYHPSSSNHFGNTNHQTGWPHTGGTYRDMVTSSATHLGASQHNGPLSAGQFYAQNMMMGSWRTYDGTGFQRTSYGKLFQFPISYL